MRDPSHHKSVQGCNEVRSSQSCPANPVRPRRSCQGGAANPAEPVHSVLSVQLWPGSEGPVTIQRSQYRTVTYCRAGAVLSVCSINLVRFVPGWFRLVSPVRSRPEASRSLGRSGPVQLILARQPSSVASYQVSPHCSACAVQRVPPVQSSLFSPVHSVPPTRSSPVQPSPVQVRLKSVRPSQFRFSRYCLFKKQSVQPISTTAQSVQPRPELASQSRSGLQHSQSSPINLV